MSLIQWKFKLCQWSPGEITNNFVKPSLIDFVLVLLLQDGSDISIKCYTGCLQSDAPASMVLDSEIDRAVFKNLSVKDCPGKQHLCENINNVTIADLNIWDKPLTFTDMTDYTTCRLYK